MGVAPWEVAPELFSRPGTDPPGVKPTPEVQEQFSGYIATLAFKIARNPADVDDLKGAGREGLTSSSIDRGRGVLVGPPLDGEEASP